MWGWRPALVSPCPTSAPWLCATLGALIPPPSAETTHGSALAVFLSTAGRRSILLSVYLSNINVDVGMCVCISRCKREKCSLFLLGEELADPLGRSEPPHSIRQPGWGQRELKKLQRGTEKLGGRLDAGAGAPYVPYGVCVRGDRQRDSHRERVSPSTTLVSVFPDKRGCGHLCAESPGFKRKVTRFMIKSQLPASMLAGCRKSILC